MSTRRIAAATGNTRASKGRGQRNIDLSQAELASSELARDINRDIVLEFIRLRQPVSRVDLSRQSGLQPSTISAIVGELLEENWVVEGAVVQGLRGRPSTMISINHDLVTLALDLRPEAANLAVVDLSGRFLAHETVALGADPRAATAQIVARMKQLRKEHADKEFQGVGVSVPGRVHPETQQILLAPNLPWSDFDLRGALEKGLGLQVEIDNDANACLLAEQWAGHLEGIRHAVLVAVSEGVGTAVLAGGQMLSGFNGLAGEFGHIPIDSKGPLCGCGQRGCWETFASSRAALQTYRKLAPKAKPVTVEELLTLAESGNPAANEAVSRQMKELGRGLRLITATLSPELILISGAVTRYWANFGPIVAKGLQETMLVGPAPRLATAGEGDLSRLSGAAAVLLRRHSSYYRSTQPSRGRKRVAEAQRKTA